MDQAHTPEVQADTTKGALMAQLIARHTTKGAPMAQLIGRHTTKGAPMAENDSGFGHTTEVHVATG